MPTRRLLASYGLLSSVLLIIAIALDLLALDHRGMAMTMIIQATWVIAVAVAMVRSSPASLPAPA